MFEAIARAEHWIRSNGPRIRGDVERAVTALERIATAAEKLANIETGVIEGTAIEESDEPAQR